MHHKIKTNKFKKKNHLFAVWHMKQVPTGLAEEKLSIDLFIALLRPQAFLTDLGGVNERRAWENES